MYETNISDKYTDLNNRIDDAFMELLAQSIGMNGLTRECKELKQELLRLQEEQKSNLLWIRILTGISAGLWFILLMLKFI